jgi:hypothetical protein
MEFNSSDIVQLRRVNNVHWVSGPKGEMPDPHGNWIIVGFVGIDVLIAKDGTCVRVPVSDIRRVGVFSTENVMAHLASIGKKVPNGIDMVSEVSEIMGWNSMKSKKFLKRYNLPEKAMNEIHKERLIEFVKDVAEEQGE